MHNPANNNAQICTPRPLAPVYFSCRALDTHGCNAHQRRRLVVGAPAASYPDAVHVFAAIRS